MNFSAFILSRNITASPRGALLADAKSWIGAGAFPDVTSWADLHRYLCRRHTPNETIALARSLWREYRKLDSQRNRKSEAAGVAA